jgi:MFS family permease
MSAFQLTYSLLQIPTGQLSDRRGSRLCLPIFSVIWSASTLCLAKATGLWSMVAARLAKGVGQAGLFPGSTNTFARWVPEHERALFNGTLASCMTLGTGIAVLLGAWIVENHGWRWMFSLFALPGLLWAAGFWWWFRDRPREHPAVNVAELEKIEATAAVKDSPGKATSKMSWRQLGYSPAATWICLQQFFRAAAQMFFMTWFPSYMQTVYHAERIESGILTLVTQIPLLLGSLIGGTVIDAIYRRTGSRRASRQGVAVVSLLLSALLILLSYPVEDKNLAIILISAGAFFAGTAGPAGYTITIDMGGRHVATLFSTMNMIGNVGAMGFPLVVGAIVSMTGRWDMALLLFGGSYVAAAFCWWRLNPDGTVFDQMPPDKRPPEYTDADAR